MKKFARCILILILVAILSGVGGYIYENNTMTPMYESVAKLYVVPGSQNEASIRAKNGGLNHDFMIIFSSKVVIESAQRLAGTSEDISEYLTVSSPADSNIVELKVVNPDQNTAKAYVDAVAKTAVKTTTIIPVESMQILSEGTSDGVATKPDLYYYTALIMGAACAVCVFIEIVVCLILCAFKKKEDHSDDEFEYEARFGRYAYPRREYIETEADSTKRIVNDNKRKASSDDILAAFDDDDDDDDDDEYDDSFLYHSSDNSNANVAESEKTPEAPVMESEEIPDKAVKEAAATKEEYKPEPVVEAEPIQEAAPVVEEPILEKQDEPTLVDEEPAQIVVDTPVEEEQPEEEAEPVEEEQPEEEVKPVEEEQPEEEVKPVEEEQLEEEVKPVEEEQPEEEVKPEEEEQPEEKVKPVEEEQPEEEVKPEEEEQPEEEVKPVEEQPEEEVKPVEEEQPEEEVKPVEEEQPEEKAEPVEEEQQAVEEVEPASKIIILGRIYK